MASQKILAQKQEAIDEFAKTVTDSAATVVVDLRGLTVSETTELRRQLRETGSDIKVFKNTLAKRAMNSLNYNIDEQLEGPSAFAFGTDAIAPVKVLANFAKEHEALQLKVGIIDGEVSDIDVLNQLATIPSREGLLTMLAGGLIAIPRDLSICLNLYVEQNNDGSVVESPTEETTEEVVETTETEVPAEAEETPAIEESSEEQTESSEDETTE